MHSLSGQEPRVILKRLRLLWLPEKLASLRCKQNHSVAGVLLPEAAVFLLRIAPCRIVAGLWLLGRDLLPGLIHPRETIK